MQYRDQKETVETVTRHHYDGDNTWTSDHQNLTYKAYRSVSQPTVPNGNGSYFEATNYEAFRLVNLGSKFTEDWQSRQWILVHWVEQPRSGSSGPATAELLGVNPIAIAGCRVAFPHIPEITFGLQQEVFGRISRSVHNAKWDLGETVADIDSAVLTIINRLYQLAAIFRGWRRGSKTAIERSVRKSRKRSRPHNFREKIRRATADSANGWLELKFAWLPLLSDIKQALDALKEGLEDNPQLKHIMVDESRTETRGASEINYGVKAKVTLHLRSSSIAVLSSLGLSNPAGILWNRMPLSFMVDWLIPIGTAINTLSAGSGYSLENSWTTSWVDANVVVDDGVEIPSWTGPSWRQVKGQSTAQGRWKVQSHRRDILPVLPPVVPTVIDTVSWSKLSTALGIAVAAIMGDAPLPRRG